MIHTPAHVILFIKPSKLQKYVFHHYKGMTGSKLIVSVAKLESVKMKTRKTGNTKLVYLKKEKFWVIIKKGQTPVEFVYIVEEHYYQIFISAEICLHWDSSDNENTALIAWKRFWSWTLLYHSFTFQWPK